MTIKAKLTVLMVFCMAAFVSLAVLNKAMEKKRLGEMFVAEESSSEITFDKTLELLGRPLEMYVNYYTHWNELSGFVASGDRGWAAANIEASFASYRSDAVWIYGTDKSVIYSANSAGDEKLKAPPVPWPVIADLFSGSCACHFFSMTPAGPLEIRGACIHALSDLGRTGRPVGYFLAGRLWTKAYLAEISRLTGTAVSLAGVGSDGLHRHVSDPARGIIAFSRVMKDWEARPAFRINILRESESIKVFTRASNQMIGLIVIYSAILLIVLWISFTNWINRPLGRISAAVMNKRPIEDKALLRKGGEFSELAAILNKFYEHRERLTSEIVAHRSAESALRLSEEKFSKAFRANPNPMAIFARADGRFLDVNEAFLRITGHDRKKVIDHTVEELGLLEDGTRGELFGMLESRGVVRDIELGISTAEGGKRSWLFSASTIDIGDDRIILAVANDISERKHVEKSLDETQRQLVQSEKLAALGRFASGLAHEVKNPLAILLGGVEFLRDKLSDTEPEVREAITKMREAVMRANIVVKDLLSFARPSKLIFERVHPDALVRDAIGFVELFRHKSDTAEIEIKHDKSGEEMYVEVDKNQMQQVLFNILLNAIEAVPMKGEISICTYKDGDFCAIEVKDNGRGIAKDDLPKLFEPFFTTKRDKKGTGLGLSIVKSIVERHKGTIGIESDPGDGTTVKIRLPAAAREGKDKEKGA